MGQLLIWVKQGRPKHRQDKCEGDLEGSIGVEVEALEFTDAGQQVRVAEVME